MAYQLKWFVLFTAPSLLCGCPQCKSNILVFLHRAKGGLDAERAERVKCKQEDMERDRRNFEAMQVDLHPLQPCDLLTIITYAMPVRCHETF